MILSVVIPVYNTLAYLPECLQSLEKQNTDVEIVLVDDGSSDGSAAYCEEYKAAHDHVTVIRQENRGASDARNAGLRAAHGDYIHFVDSDDMLGDENAYAEFVKTIYPLKPDIVFSRCAEYSSDMKTLLKTQPEYFKNGFDSGDILYEVLINHYESTLTCPVNKFFRRDFLIDNELYFFSGIQHEEDEWLPRVIQSAGTVYFDNRILYSARRGRDNALSNTPNEEVLTRKALSLVKIADLGFHYMQSRPLREQTMSLVMEYYWDYLTDACVACAKMKDKRNKEKVYAQMKEHKDFFDSYHYLKSRNRRIMGMMFRTLGIPLTVRIVGLRYGK